MGLIREPKGVDFIVGPSVITDEDRKIISEIISNYKRTHRLPAKTKNQKPTARKKTIRNKSIAAGKA